MASAEESKNEYLSTLYAEFSFRCHKEKNPDGCFSLAEYMRVIRGDSTSARELYLKNCDEDNHGPSCFQLGYMYLRGTGGSKRDIKAAFDTFSKGCLLGDRTSCYNAASLVSQNHEQLGGRNMTKAVEFLEKACEKGFERACHSLFPFYRDGYKKEGLKPDLEKAFKLAFNECENNHMDSCINLSVMYEKGQWVGKDEQLAQKYRTKAEKLYSTSNDTFKNVQHAQ